MSYAQKSRYLLNEAANIYAEEGTKQLAKSTWNYTSNKFKIMYLQKRHGDTLTKDINGSVMEIDLRATGIDRDLVLNGVREPKSTQEFAYDLKQFKQETEGNVHVLDIGANIGYFALLEARILEDAGNIYAVEPAPGNINRLKKNIELNSYDNIKVIQGSVGAENSQLNLTIEENSNHHKMAEISNQNSQTISVDVLPIDDLIRRINLENNEPIIIRMDIEGYEKYAFNGMTDTLKLDQPIHVFFELHEGVENHDVVTNILNPLQENGFHIRWFSPDKGESINYDKKFDNVPLNSTVHVMASRT